MLYSSHNKTKRIIVWLRHELRLHDNQALYHACTDAVEVIPCIFLDDEFDRYSPAKKAVALASLRELDASLRKLGGKLVVKRGNPETILPEMLEKYQIEGLYYAEAFEQQARERQLALCKQVESSGRFWHEFQDTLLFHPASIRTGSGTVYTVFTPFKATCLSRLQDVAPPLPPPQEISVPEIESDAFAGYGELTDFPGMQAGEQNAITALHKFLETKVNNYADFRDVVSAEGTSRLSHHLALGTLSVRTAVHEVRKKSVSNRGAGTFLSELLWREFFYHVLKNFPHVVRGSFKSQFDGLEWGGKEEWFHAWCNGATGYPIVDAGMRQLNTTFWMHNRARMITASFLTKDLHIDWRRGEQYFLSRLADGDLALNNGGWQWCAGTGTDAQPWFRIFNPVLQGKKFDSEGAYVRRYVPELEHVPSRYIHEPWTMPRSLQEHTGCIIGKNYPAPIISHEAERKITLESYGAVKR